MILIDAVYINDSGGKILLDYLIEKLENTDRKIYYLLDERLLHINFHIKDSNTITFLKSGLKNRNLFYKKNKDIFSTVLCFANLPPTIKLSCKVYVYFHQRLFLEIPPSYNIKTKALLWLKRKALINFKNNTDEWIVQSDTMAELLSRRIGIDLKKIFIIPFYEVIKDETVKKEKSTYLYVSNGHQHKNHLKLIDAFCKFYDIHKTGKLMLTIDRQFNTLYNLIELKKQNGYPIINYGNISRDVLGKIYYAAEYLIFPSLSESFGLGLLEAIDNNCKIIGADLPYTYAVCNPSLVFDPDNVDSIVASFTLSLGNNVKDSVSKVNNNINKLIELLE
ncbi:glycosyltransferase [Chryseobacterium taichungense]|uniref:Glycosyltransferase involved in cell wall bisynthesis n=1 Tax=Chryseobacterium taichungense TaxID=295069 RepID=A0A1H7VTX9_9FLAO|nr:glycosyltransferase [Chryseobacterium taichungense]SEM12228.1 Glycosyltransferase involved in cell wall bisynthesis [Chryseobacterium taichungense]